MADGRIPRLYSGALQIVIANRDQTRAKIFVEKAYTVRVILKGEDSPESIRLKGLAERFANHLSVSYGSDCGVDFKSERPLHIGSIQFVDFSTSLFVENCLPRVTGIRERAVLLI
jgi:hypothetical protein